MMPAATCGVNAAGAGFRRDQWPWRAGVPTARLGPQGNAVQGEAHISPPPSGGPHLWRRMAWAADLDDNQYGDYLMDDFN
jgi:hypothetical protein